MCCVWYEVYCVLCAVYGMRYTVFCVLCTSVYCVLCAVYGMRYTVSCVLCAWYEVYSIYCKLQAHILIIINIRDI